MKINFSKIFIMSILVFSAHAQARELNEKKEKPPSPNTVRYQCKPYDRACYNLPNPTTNSWIFAEAEYLFWKVYNTVPYSRKVFQVPPFTSALSGSYFGSADVKTVDMGGDSGYRFTLGTTFWGSASAYAKYRWFQADGTDSFSATIDQAGANGEFADPIWVLKLFENVTNTLPTTTTASAKQRYREKVLDLDIMNSFGCSRWNMSPHIGIRFAWLKTDLRVDYTTLDSTTPDPLNIQHHVDLNNHMNLGVGLKVGMDSNVDLGYGFGFYSKSLASILVGQFDYRVRDDITAFGTVPLERTAQTQNFKVTDFQTNWELGVGINWGKHFSCCKYYLGIKAGYDVNLWPNFFNLSSYARDGNFNNTVSLFQNYWTKSLLTHGLTVGVRFDY